MVVRATLNFPVFSTCPSNLNTVFHTLDVVPLYIPYLLTIFIMQNPWIYTLLMMQRSDALPALLKIGDVDARRSLVEIKWSHRSRGCLKSWLLFRHPREFKIKTLYSNDLILNIASKSQETVQKLQFLDSFLSCKFASKLVTA